MDKGHWTKPSPIIGKDARHYTVLENLTSRKAYWCAWIERDGNKWWVAWRFGRIGTNGRTGHTRVNGLHAAKAVLESKTHNKVNRGYLPPAGRPSGLDSQYPTPPPPLPTHVWKKTAIVWKNVVTIDNSTLEAAKLSFKAVQDAVAGSPLSPTTDSPPEIDCVEYDPLDALWT